MLPLVHSCELGLPRKLVTLLAAIVLTLVTICSGSHLCICCGNGHVCICFRFNQPGPVCLPLVFYTGIYIKSIDQGVKPVLIIIIILCQTGHLFFSEKFFARAKGRQLSTVSIQELKYIFSNAVS